MCDYNSLFREYAQYMRVIDEAKREAERIKKMIIDGMGSDNVDEVLGTEHKAQYKTIVSNRFNQAAFKAAEPAKYAQYVKPAESKRFTFN